MPLVRDELMQAEFDKVWSSREQTLQSFSMNSTGMAAMGREREAERRREINAEEELRSLQDALRARRAKERFAAEEMRRQELASPSKPVRVPSPEGIVISEPPSPAKPPSPVKQGKKGKQKEEPENTEKEENESPKKRKPKPKPAWQPVVVDEIPEPPAPSKREKSKDEEKQSQDEFLKGLYTKGKEFQKKKETDIKRKGKEMEADNPVSGKPEITPYAKELRQNVKRDDKALGEYYYSTGLNFRKKRDMALKRKKKELMEDEGLLGRPQISEMAQGLREANKTPESIGKFMFERGNAFKTRREQNIARKRNEMVQDEGSTFAPQITEKTKILASSAEARAAGLMAGEGMESKMSAPEARMYDKGQLFNFAKATNVEKKRKEAQEERDKELVHKPVINERSKKLASRLASKHSIQTPRSPSPPPTGDDDDDFLPIPRTSTLATPYRNVSPLFSDDDLLAPPSIEAIINDIRFKQDMRRLGV
eukprot:TRINITY_DN10530_c0_g2_i1.p1 TRINITY_DN10530_c0_g2~~TRINITY_DN10530_c0_g2_i1.p1  ORF type:complete len:481 (+),score=145.41 TRINITY_DN10530_c0_g2_i1:35-1477(+)